jgi:integrase
MKFTVKSIAGLRLPEGKADHIEWDDDLPGFGLRLREGGSRNWVFQYALGQKQRRMSLGSATAITLVKARETASELHAKVRLGHDPAGQKAESQQRAIETFEAVARMYLAAIKQEMRPGSYAEVERHLLKHCKPLYGLQLVGVDQRTIATRLNDVKEGPGDVTANRVRSSLSAMYGWAMQQGIAAQNPVALTGKNDEKSRERVLTDDELRVIWTEAGEDQYGSIVKLLMLSAQRADEMASLRRSEIAKVEVSESHISGIKLPAFTIDAIELEPERTKNKRPHIVPLSKPALAIMEKQPVRVRADSKVRDLIFGTGQGGFSGWSRCKERLDKRVLKALRKLAEDRHDEKMLDRLAKVEDLKARIAKTRANSPEWKALSKQLKAIWWTLHDLRRTADTMMNDRLGIAPHVVDAILNHVSSQRSGKSGVSGVYNKALYLRERTEALRLWADHIMALVGGNVFPIGRTAGRG